MRPYEVMVIFDTGAEPPAIQAVVERILETVRTRGGTPGAVDRWGRRPLAYEVRHRREGYYVVIEFSGEPALVDELDRMLSLADEVLRHKVVRIPDKVAQGSARREPVRREQPRREQSRPDRDGAGGPRRVPAGRGEAHGD